MRSSLGGPPTSSVSAQSDADHISSSCPFEIAVPAGAPAFNHKRLCCERCVRFLLV